MGRFINADSITGEASDILTHNMFAYCVNNPVNKQDSTGYWVESALDDASFCASLDALAQDRSIGNAIGLIIDGIALATPFISGGVGLAKKAIKAADNVKTATEITYDFVTVGRWMGKGEYSKMVKTGKVQESIN